MKYRKKPVVIDAVQFLDTTESMLALGELMDKEVIVDYEDSDNPVMRIATLEGTMTANLGDYIIKGGADELYPCKPDIFEATYEPVE